MKIAVANVEGVPTLVSPVEGEWIDLSRAYHDYQRVIDYIDGQTMHRIEEVLARGLLNKAFFDRVFDFVHKPGMFHQYALREEPALLQPIRPNKVIAVCRNYPEFVTQGHYAPPEEPIIYAKAASACVGPNEPIILRERYGRVDHEGELAVIIGKHAQDVRPEDAQGYVAGYTIVNDVTARDIQAHDIARGYPWYRSKNLATFCPIGPSVLLPEALGWPPEVDIEVRVNGEVRQRGNTRDFIFGIGEVIAAITKFIPLEPGDIVSTGTPAGVSAIVPGDIVEIEVPQIGILRNPVISGGA